MKKELKKLIKDLEDHCCCTWGHSERCKETKFHGYCNYELDHGIEIEEIVEELKRLSNLTQ